MRTEVEVFVDDEYSCLYTDDSLWNNILTFDNLKVITVEIFTDEDFSVGMIWALGAPEELAFTNIRDPYVNVDQTIAPANWIMI